MIHYKPKGVPRGYVHNWKYKGHWREKKIGKYWKVDFRATKSRKTARSMGSFGIGTKGAWKIKGIQYIKKTGKGKYQTRLIARKYPLKFHVKKPRKHHSYQ